MLAKPLLYWHTLRYLRPVQFWGRLRARLGHVRVRQLPAIPRRAGFAAFADCAFAGQSYFPPSRFEFLGEAHEVSANWDDPALPLLWRYNLHYFDDLCACSSPERVAAQWQLMQRWMAENPAPVGTAWAPYPTSLRIVNWVKWLSRQPAFAAQCADNLAAHADVLSQQLEFHLLGNHLFENARALVFAGTWFAGAQADAWRHRGLGILVQQLDEQFLADGAHFERSPMYHATMLWGLLDVIELASLVSLSDLDSVAGKCREHVSRGLSWLAAMTHPDGQISFFNDAAFGVAPTLAQLEERASGFDVRPSCTLQVAENGGLRLEDMRASGYWRVRWADAEMIADAAAVGPDYLPGHAHADTLSFEFSLGGQRVLVNSGTSCYGHSAERQRQRSTSAHNTLEVDGQDSSEVWGGFRVARRAYVRARAAAPERQGFALAAAQDGYRRLRGRVMHERRWNCQPGALHVDDILTGQWGRARARFYLHPEVAALADGPGRVILQLPSGHTLRFESEGGELDIVPATWHPRFGEQVPNLCIEIRATAARLSYRFNW